MSTGHPCALCEAVTHDVVCASCAADVRALLTRAPYVYVQAHVRLGVERHGERVHVTTAPESRPPLNGSLLDTMDTLARGLGRWEAATAPLVGISLPRAASWPVVVGRACSLLERHVRDALRAPGGQAAHLHVRRHVRDIDVALGHARLVHRLAAPCPVCDARSLVRVNGEDRVSCGMCGNAWPESRYTLLARVLAGQAGHGYAVS